MKPHLPFSLLAAILTAFVVLPAQAVEAPDGYTATNLNTPSALENYASLHTNEYVAFMPESSLEFSPASNDYWTDSTPLISGGNVFFGSTNSTVGLSFKEGSYSAFSEQNTLAFDALSNLTFSTIEGTAINLSDNGTLSITNINDSQSDTVDVLFEKVNNIDSAFYPTIIGGAIRASEVIISHNGDVTFSENSSQDIPGSTSGTPHSGAIYAKNGLTISYNEDVTFSRNTGSEGGAIYTEDELFISHNGDVTFSDNAAISGASHNGGGAIVVYSWLTISNNDYVSFSGNSVVTNVFSNAYGGAIYTTDKLTISNNDYVSFSENSCSANSHTLTYGGAIYAAKEISIFNNGLVSICDNSTYTDYNGLPAGGAIYAASSLNISNNRDVYFISNSASSGNTPAPYGGAIYATDGLTISNNSNVFITVNSVSSTNSSSAYGGAIYVSSGNLSMQGNETVLFERNYEKCGSTYRLRSIYMNSGSMILSAKTGRDITFRDSVYTAGDSYFNSDYTDANGNTQSAGGDIIFTGKYTEENLKEVLAINNEGRTATAEEILNSQTSTIEGNAYVNGGSLQITDGAILNVNGDTINIAAGSNATLAINDAELVAANATIDVGASATLQLSNGASVTADKISIAAGATLSLGDIAITADASNPMVAAYRLSSLNVINADLTFAAGSTLMSDGTGISMTEGSVLTFMATSEGEKINLVFTLGAEYSEDGLMQLFSNVDIVKFLMDGKEVDSSTTLMASDFFTGDYINENTTLTYDSSSGNIYIAQGSNIPEPTTATLSLLALAGLAARRRRR